MYPYTLERVSEKIVHFVSKDARIDQEFLSEDVSELILDLPNLIIAEQVVKNTFYRANIMRSDDSQSNIRLISQC